MYLHEYSLPSLHMPKMWLQHWRMAPNRCRTVAGKITYVYEQLDVNNGLATFLMFQLNVFWQYSPEPLLDEVSKGNLPCFLLDSKRPHL